MVDFRDSLVARRISLLLIVSLLLEITAPAFARPFWQDRPNYPQGRTQPQRQRQNVHPRDAQIEKVLNRIRAPLNPALGVSADSDLLPDLISQNSPPLIAADLPEQEKHQPEPTETPQAKDQESSPTPSASPTPRRFPVPNWTPAPSGWDCYTPSPSPTPCSSKDRHDAKDTDSRDHDDGENHDSEEEGPSAGHHEHDGDDIDQGDDAPDDCHRRQIKAQLAQIVLPTDVGPAIHEWSRRTVFNGPLFAVSDPTKPSIYSLDYALVLKKQYPLSNPGTHTVTWDFLSPNADSNKSGRHSAASISFVYRSQGRLASSPASRYKVQAHVWDIKSPFGRTVALESMTGQLSSYKAIGGVTARDLGQWAFVETVDGTRTSSSFTVVDPPNPTAEWSRRVENRWETIVAPFAAYVNDEWLSRRKIVYFPDPTSSPLHSQCAANRRTVVEWHWRVKSKPELNTTSLHSFMSVRMVYRTTRDRYCLATYVFDDAYRKGRLYSQQTGSGTLPSAPLAWGSGIPDYGDIELEEQINGVQTELFTLQGRRIDAVALSKGRFYVDDGPLEFDVQISTYPIDSALKSGRWILDIRDAATGKILYSQMQPFANSEGRSFLSYRILWDGTGNGGVPIALGTKVTAEVTVKGYRDPAATLAALTNVSATRQKGLRNVPERQRPHARSCPHCHKQPAKGEGGQGPAGGSGGGSGGNVTYNADGTYGTWPPGFFNVNDIYVDQNGVYQWPSPAGFAPGIGAAGDQWIIASADPAQGISHINLLKVLINLRLLYSTLAGTPVITDRYQEPPIRVTNLGALELLERVTFQYFIPSTGQESAGDPSDIYLHNLNAGYSIRVIPWGVPGPVPDRINYGYGGTDSWFNHPVDATTVVHTPALDSETIELLSGASRNVATNYYGVTQALGASDVHNPDSVPSNIDIGSGELRTSETDLAIATAGLPLQITRHYVAHTDQAAFTDAPTLVQLFIGKCTATGDIFHTHTDNWIWSFQEDLEMQDFFRKGNDWIPSEICHRRANGAEDSYFYNGSTGNYQSVRPDVVSSIEVVGPDTYELVLKSKVRKRFQRFAEIAGQPNYVQTFLKRSNHCYLVQERDRNNNVLNYHWDSSGIRLQSVDDGRRTLITCAWEDRPSSIQTRFGVQAYFAYLNPVIGFNGGRALFTGPKCELTLTSLKSITDLSGRKVTYDYKTPPLANLFGATGYLTAYVDLRYLNHVVQPGGRTLDYTYLERFTNYSPPWNPYYWTSDLVQPGWAFNAPIVYYNLIKFKFEHQMRSVAVNGVTRNIFARHDYDTALINEVSQPGLGAVTFENHQNNPSLGASNQRITTVPQVAQPTAQVWNFETDQLKRVTGMIDPKNQSLQLTLDIANNLTSLIDQLGKLSVQTFDNRRNLLTATDPLGHTTLLGWDSNDDLKEVRNARGDSVFLEYDAHHNVISSRDQENRTSRMTYSSTGGVLTTQDPLNNVWNFQYDVDGFLIGKTAPASADNPTRPHWTYGMDILKRRISVTDPLQRTSTCTYDVRDHLTSTTLPATTGEGLQTGRPPATTVSEFNLDDLLTQTTDSLGRITKYQYDDFLRLILVRHPGNTTTKIAYDGFNNVHSTTNENGQDTVYDYDSLNRATTVHYPGAGDETFDFDEAGNLKKLTKTDGTEVNYTYNDGNQLTLIDGGTSQVGYTYNELGLLATMNDSNGQTNYHYTPASNLHSIEKPNNQSLTMDYDDNNRLTSVVDQDNDETVYRYNELNQLKHVHLGNGSADYAYNLVGDVVSTQFGNGMQSAQTYDERDQLLSKTYSHPNIGPLLTVQYSHDQLGRRQAYRRIDPQGVDTRVYTYRVKGELINTDVTSDHVDGSSESRNYSYDFDNNSNRTRVNNNTYSHNAADQLLNGTGITQQFNDAGSVINLNNDNGELNLRYDFRDQLLGVDTPSQSVSYKYDGDNLRVQKNAGGVITNYLTFAGQVIKEYDENFHPTQAYLPGVGWRHQNNNDDWNYYLTDGLGSVLGIVNSSGDYVARYDYGDYGDLLSSSGPLADENTFRYTGEQFDAETGFYYLRNRYYQPQFGCFLQRDPVRQGAGPNMMAYCGGDPINNADPSGLQPSPWPYIKGGNMGSLRRPAPPRVVQYQQEGVTGLSTADHMMGGVIAKDLLWMGKNAGGFAARAVVAEDTWAGAGKLIRAAGSKGGTAAEEAFAAQLAGSGRHVETRFGLQGVDFVVEGVEWEFKGLTKLGPDTLKSAIETAVKDNKASRIFIDASEFEVNEAYVTSTMNRLHGNGYINQINDVIIYGKDVVYRYNYH